MPRNYLLQFLQAVEAAIPPPPNCHHALTAGRYGSDAAGWEPKLILQINRGGTFWQYFLDEGDTTEAIVAHISKDPGPGMQRGVALGQFVQEIPEEGT